MVIHSFIHSGNIEALVQCSLPPHFGPLSDLSSLYARAVFPEYQWVRDVCKVYQWLPIILKIKSKLLKRFTRPLVV